MMKTNTNNENNKVGHIYITQKIDKMNHLKYNDNFYLNNQNNKNYFIFKRFNNEITIKNIVFQSN